jgi:hypothetical protein
MTITSFARPTAITPRGHIPAIPAPGYADLGVGHCINIKDPK